MLKVPQRVSLIAQTVEVLGEGIAGGRWKKRLPGERRLGLELQVSRWTLRAALARLAERKLIRIRQGRSCEIVARGQKGGRTRRPVKIGYIWPDSVLHLRPFVALMFDEMRARVQKMGGEVDVFYGRKYYGPGCAGPLTQLVEQNPHTCWILALSTEPVQRWFEARGLPVIVGGSLHAGVKLASINIDYHAIGRHAGGALLARGHGRVALLASNRGVAGGYPGGLEIEAGLREAFAHSQHREEEPIVVHHDGDPVQVCRILTRLRGMPRSPTALLIADSPTLLTTLTHLGRSGIVVPRDLSLLVAEDEPYYPQIVPTLSHYQWILEEFTAQWARLIRHAIGGTLGADTCVRIVPRFVPGETLKRLPGG